MNVRVIFIPLSMVESIDSNKEVFKCIPPAAVVFSHEYELVRTKLINNPEFTNFNYLLALESEHKKYLPKIKIGFLTFINNLIKSGIYHQKCPIVFILKDEYLEDIPAKDYDDGDMSLKEYIGLMNGWELLRGDVLSTVKNEPKVIVGQTIYRTQGFTQVELIKDNIYYKDCEFIIKQEISNADLYAYINNSMQSDEMYLLNCVFKFSTLEVKPSKDKRLTVHKALENTYCGNTDANMKRYNDNGWTYIDSLSRGNQLLLVAEVVLGREVCYAVGPERVENSAYLTRINDMEVKDKTWK